MEKNNLPHKQENESVIFGKKVTGWKATAVGVILGVVFGLVIVGILALIIMNI